MDLNIVYRMLWHYNEKIYIFISIIFILTFLKKVKYNKL